MVRVADHPGVLAQAVLRAVQGGEGFCGASSPQVNRSGIQLVLTQSGETVGVKGVQGLALFEHHQIGDVNHVVDRPEPRALEPALKPSGRRADLHAREGRQAEQPALLDPVLDVRANGQGRCGDRGCCCRQAQGGTGQGGHLTGDAQHREAIGAIRRDRQFQNLIVETKQGPNGTPHRGQGLQSVIEDDDAVRTVGESQFGEGADHAAAGDSAQLRWFDLQIDRRQIGTHGGDRHVNPGADVLGAADDLQWLICANGNGADAQLVGIGMGLPLLHIADDHAGCPGGQIDDLFDFKARNRELLSEDIGCQITGHQLPEPLERDLHRTRANRASTLKRQDARPGQATRYGCPLSNRIAPAAQRPLWLRTRASGS